MRVVLATNNAGKLREFRELLAPLGFDIEPLSSFTREAAEETGLSFIENAILKARHAARAASLPAIADDSGIEVDVLEGAPGIYSARFAGQGASDRANLEKLLLAVRDVPTEQRTARYQCALVFTRSTMDFSPFVCQASWEGRLAATPRGTGGFGYDPIFELPELGKTAAELSADEKNRISHRGKALRELVAGLRSGRYG
jgi:XTP/dITP diphosphohydrolase